MADGVKVEIVSPEALILSTEARSVVVPGAEGYMTVLGDHAPVMTVLKPGFVTVTDGAGVVLSYFVAGGFADISDDGVAILAEEARLAGEFGRADIEARITAAQAALDAADGLEARSDAQAVLDTWKNLLLEIGTVGATAH